jgi:hypothetical protein
LTSRLRVDFNLLSQAGPELSPRLLVRAKLGAGASTQILNENTIESGAAIHKFENMPSRGANHVSSQSPERAFRDFDVLREVDPWLRRHNAIALA